MGPNFEPCTIIYAHTVISRPPLRLWMDHMPTISQTWYEIRSKKPCSMKSKVRRLHSRAKLFVAKFEQGLNETNYLHEAIILDREALKLCPPGHAKRSVSLIWLAIHLSDRYDQFGATMDLEEAINLTREGLDLRPAGHPGRSMALNTLAVCLSARYERFGKFEDLDEAMALDQEALELRPPGHPERLMSLNNLAARLSIRYKQLGTMEDLDKAIVLNQEAVDLCTLWNPDRPMFLNNLAVHLSARYRHFGTMEDLDEAISLDREALNLHPLGHPNRSLSFNNLAVRLSTRYDQLRTIEDLNEAITLSREALELRPWGHPLRSISLNNLALYLSARYKQIRVIEDLNEAISLDREALNLRPQGHPLRSSSLNNLGLCLFAQYKQFGAMDDLDEAIALDREALDLLSPTHPERSMSLSNLAMYLSTRYEQLGEMQDLKDAIIFVQGGLALCAPGHPYRSLLLENLASYLRTQFMWSKQVEDKDAIFSLYGQLVDVPQMVSSTYLSAARAWVRAAEDFQHPTTLLAYETSLRSLIHHLATLPSLPQHLSVLKNVTSSLAVDAFSACLRNSALTRAIELLEQGRGVFWSQLTRLRSPLDDVIASGPAGKILADEFMQLSSLIYDALDSPGADQHERVCHLNLEMQRVVANIRELLGLSCFLLPSLFSDLQRVACQGPVIIVNSSKYGCDALVILDDQDPVHIPLSITKEYVQHLSLRLSTLTVRTKLMDVTRDLGVILRELWDDVVSYIVDFLQTIFPLHSRIWWCPTAEFSLLPLHAAGPYRKGQLNLPDLYVSSYTPTLSALIRARRHDSSDSAARSKHFVSIGQAKAAGESELLSVSTELASISQRMIGLATFAQIEGTESSISRIAEELNKNQWVHLACHGLPNPEKPFESAFALHDGHFTIEHIIRCDLDNSEFAYLSACHTTVGDEESPDEVIHLAAAMQFAGFRSVIGTMWAVDDAETNKITSVFYKYMIDRSGRLDHTRAAYALNKTMKSVNVPLDQRILYIHLGA